jgi:DNA-binding NarL/FixJ family response regulator
MLQILLADRLASARSATRMFLSRYTGEWQIVAEAADEAALLQYLGDACADVVIMHAGIAKMALPDLVRQLRSACPQVRVLVTSGDPDLETAVKAAGADDFMYLGDPPPRLVTKLRIIQMEQY